MDFVKQFRHYLHGRKCHTRTDLRTVLKVKEPEGQLEVDSVHGFAYL